KLKLTVAQLPYDPQDRWVGLPLKDAPSMPGGKLSVAIQPGAPIDVHRPLAGLLIDEWVEVVPNATEQPASPFSTINRILRLRNQFSSRCRRRSVCPGLSGRCSRCCWKPSIWPEFALWIPTLWTK